MIKARPSTTKKGEKVRSRSEKIVADLLNEMGIHYIYEMPIKINGEPFLPDFYLPDFDIFIEFFGLASNKKYNKRMKEKMVKYQKAKIKLISLFPSSIKKKAKFKAQLLTKLKKLI